MDRKTANHDSPEPDDLPMTGEEDPLAEVSEGDFAPVVAAFTRSERDRKRTPGEDR